MSVGYVDLDASSDGVELLRYMPGLPTRMEGRRDKLSPRPLVHAGATAQRRRLPVLVLSSMLLPPPPPPAHRAERVAEVVCVVPCRPGCRVPIPPRHRRPTG